VAIGGTQITHYNRTLGDIYLTNGAILHLVSADKPDRLRGYNLAGAWCDEVSSWRYPDAWYLTLLPALRDIRSDPRVVVTSTPKPAGLLRDLVDASAATGSTVITRGSTFDNADNLSAKFIAEMRERYEGTRRGRQELYGELLTDVEGALVTQQMIDEARLTTMPDVAMVRIVVAVDPATTSGEHSDETGIIVCAKGIDGFGYVLADYSCKDTPDGWARRVAAAYETHNADRVVAEKNQGGDMVESVVRSVHPNIAYKGINARQGKRLRAEPVAALYEQGRIKHVGYFTKLEDQWTQWVPSPTSDSPDRLDALVHGMTELGLVSMSGTAKQWLESMAPPCSSCGQPNDPNAVTCSKCGKQLREGDTAQPFSLTSQPPLLPPNPQVQATLDAIKRYGPQSGIPDIRRY
jgi:phage terminase large subunit-like protein